MSRSKIQIAIISILTAASLSACDSKSGVNQPGTAAPQVEPRPETSPSPSPQPDSDEHMADGWSKIISDGVYSGTSKMNYGMKATITDTGHYWAEQNICSFTAGDEASMEAAEWNTFVETMNAVVKAPMAPDEQCFVIPESGSGIGGDVTVTGDGGAKIVLYTFKWDYEGRTGCTKIADRTMAKQLLLKLNDVFSRAGLQGCPTDGTQGRG